MLPDPITLNPTRYAEAHLAVVGTGQGQVSPLLALPFSKTGTFNTSSTFRAVELFENGTTPTEGSVLAKTLGLSLRVSNDTSGKGSGTKIRILRQLTCNFPTGLVRDTNDAITGVTFGSSPPVVKSNHVLELPIPPGADPLVTGIIVNLLLTSMVDLMIGPKSSMINEGFV